MGLDSAPVIDPYLKNAMPDALCDYPNSIIVTHHPNATDRTVDCQNVPLLLAMSRLPASPFSGFCWLYGSEPVANADGGAQLIVFALRQEVVVAKTVGRGVEIQG